MDTPRQQEYLSSKDAGAILGYTHDYISRLCRHGKMSGIQKGREWYVTREEIEAFKQRHEVELQEKKKELSKKFSKIRLEAEARKREARKQEQLSSTGVTKEKISFKIPKQFVLIGVFLLFVLIQNFSFNFSNIKPDISLHNLSYIDIQKSIEEGIEETILEQATVVEPTLEVIASAQYLVDGYAEFYKTIAELPMNFLSFLNTVGSEYLVIHLEQGEILLETYKDMNKMGAFVLSGYELIGESFWYGVQDIALIYKDIFKQNRLLESTLIYPKKYLSHVEGGFEYLKEEYDFNSIDKIIYTGVSTIMFGVSNISQNLASVQTTAFSISSSIRGTVGSFFEFDLSKKEEKIKTIKLKN